jgi:hypothetical protein
MGIIDTMHVLHNPLGLYSTHEGGNVKLQIENWSQHKDIQLIDTFPAENLGLIYYFSERVSLKK